MKLVSDVCKKVVALLSLYIEDKLSLEEKIFIENHFEACSDCYKKYLEMKEIMVNLHFEYKKLLSEFEKIENNKTFNIREYETFYTNISPYIDDELSYDDCVKFRKYLLKSKSARGELASAYSLKNNIKKSFSSFKENTNINFSKKIIKKLQNENRDSFENVYRRAAIFLFFMLSSLIIFSIYLSFNYLNKSFAKETQPEFAENVDFRNEEDFVEFFFDENNQALLTEK